MIALTDKKVKRETRLEKSEIIGNWNVTFEGIYCGYIERKKRFGYANYRLFNSNGQYLGISETRIDAKLYLSFHHLQEVLKWTIKIK